VAACDLYDGRHTLAQKIVGKKIPTTRRYKDLLDNKEIDCLIAAVPDHWHKQVVVDAVNAGKDIYCEKPMSTPPPTASPWSPPRKKTGRVVQIGSQRVSSVICAKAKELLATASSALSLSSKARTAARSHRRVEYPPPPDLFSRQLRLEHCGRATPQAAVDPDTSPKYFARWRCVEEYGTGLAGDLAPCTRR